MENKQVLKSLSLRIDDPESWEERSNYIMEMGVPKDIETIRLLLRNLSNSSSNLDNVDNELILTLIEECEFDSWFVALLFELDYLSRTSVSQSFLKLLLKSVSNFSTETILTIFHEQEDSLKSKVKNTLEKDMFTKLEDPVHSHSYNDEIKVIKVLKTA